MEEMLKTVFCKKAVFPVENVWIFPQLDKNKNVSIFHEKTGFSTVSTAPTTISKK